MKLDIRKATATGKRRGPNIEKDEGRNIIRLYVEEKWNLGELQRAFGRNRTTISKYLKRHGIEIRPRKYKRNLTDAQEERACVLYKRGYTIDDVAQVFDVSQGCISSVLFRHRVKTRGRYGLRALRERIERIEKHLGIFEEEEPDEKGAGPKTDA